MDGCCRCTTGAADRQLLYSNPVVQPANLALRNAWFSGGVEWNIGTRGHSPTTMDTLHAAIVEGPGGDPVLRLWEWERIRGVVFQIDLWMPSSSAVLLARTRIRNVNDMATPMYWWTNAAITVSADTRVIAPATRAFRTEYPSGLRVTGVPDDGDGDVTFPASQANAADFFFDVAAQQRPWIVAVGGDGAGTAHVSTAALRGRKLFVWGTGRGGRRWQQWLSHGGDEVYAEIQGGLAPTQFEHVTMPARAECSWTEAFGAISVDATRSHGGDWDEAVAARRPGGQRDGLDRATRHVAPCGWRRRRSATSRDRGHGLRVGGRGTAAPERRRNCLVRRRWHPVPRLHVRTGSGGLADVAAHRAAPATLAVGCSAVLRHGR